MMQEHKLSMVEPILIKFKEMYQKKLFIDSNNY